MKIFITGSTGFVGKHLSNLLATEGHELYLLARSPLKLPENLRQYAVKGDLSKKSIISWISKLPKDLEKVIHIAGIVHSFNKKLFYDVNEVGTKDLLDSFKNSFNTIHFIHFSSLAAAGPAQKNLLKKETDKQAPISHYGKSKLNGENYVLNNIPSNWNYNVIRPPIVMGPDDPAFLDVFKMVKNGIIPLAGMNALNYKYSFVCVFDLIEAVNNLIKNDINNEIFFISYPQVVTMKDILDEMAKNIKPKFRIHLCMPIFFLRILSFVLYLLNKINLTNQPITPDKVNELKIQNWTCDSNKSREHNFKYDWNLTKTVKVTYNNYHENGLL